MRAEIIAFGDELTSGQRLDTNSQWLSQRLEDWGVQVRFHTAAGDELDSSVEAFRTAIQRADIVVTTGGIGPTADDLTREALSEATQRPLELNEAAWTHIQTLFQRRGRAMPKQNRSQAMFPAGSREIKNPNGTAPGIDLAVERPGQSATHIFVLPGVPAEMREMWSASLEPRLLELLGRSRSMIRHRQVKCFGVGESELEQMLPNLTARGRSPSVGITVHRATITLRVSARGLTEEECQLAMQPTINTIRNSLGPLVFGEEDDELQDAVGRLLCQQRATLATAELGTQGLVARWLAGVSEASTLYLGGWVLTSEAWRNTKLPMSGRSNAMADVAAQVAELAGAVRSRFQADYGLAIGPAPEIPLGDEGPPHIHFALATEDKLYEASKPFASHPDIRLSLAAKHALNLLRLTLTGQRVD